MKTCTETDVKRFNAKVAVTAPNDCHEWIAAKTSEGYGIFRFAGKNMTAQRFAWWISTGIWPAKLMVCHSCDNKLCCNPAHLWLGTAKENMQDALAKGRMAVGERNGSAKLTEREVRQIRTEYAARDTTYRQLADEHNVAHSLIGGVVRGESWRHVAGTIN